MTKRALVPIAPVALAVAIGASTPNPGTTGSIIYSTSAAQLLVWNGSSWQQETKFSATTPTALSATTGVVGTATDGAPHSDHQHAHGVQTDSTLHALATTSLPGFMPAADKVKVNALPSTFVQTSAGAGDAGKGVLLNSLGDVDVTMMPPGVVQDTVQVAGADTSNSASTGVDITGLAFAIPAAGTYEFEYLIHYTSAATTAGIRFGFNSGGPSFSVFTFGGNVHITATTDAPLAGNAYGAQAGASSGGGVGTLRMARVRALGTFTATGTLTLQHSSSSLGNAMVVKAGSIGKMRRLA